MNTADIKAAADLLHRAEATSTWIAPLRQTFEGLGIDEAYAIQQRNIERRIGAGSKRIGSKIGLTSAAVQKQLGVDQPDFGVLLDDMLYAQDEPVKWSALSQPKIEAEVAFVMGKDLPADEITLHELAQAIDHVLPALEIVGSRIRDWDIGIADTIADNASSSALVLGATRYRLTDVDLRLCGMVMERQGERQGEVVSLGCGAACMGNPLNALLWLARTMAARGAHLRAGDVVLSGALGPMVPVQRGDVFEAHIQGMGSVQAIFEH